jgi:hypothetical protein
MFGQQIQHRKVWENIMKACDDKNLTNELSLLRGLSVIKLNYYRNMAEYVTKIMSTAQKLTDISSLVDNKFVSVIRLSELPHEYNLTILEAEQSGLNTTSDYIKSKLNQEDLQSKSEARKIFIETALVHNENVKKEEYF